MKRLLFILPLLTLLARCTPHPTVPDAVPELVEGPFQASPALSTIDSLMWHQPDSAFALLLQFAGSPEAGSLDTFNLNYFHVLLSELFYKNNCAQSNRNELLQAVACFDSLSSALNAHPLAPSRHSGPDPESPSLYDDLPFLSARAHYINGVGYYESDSLVPACAEYLKALEVMEDHYKEKELAGHKARFMAYTYSRLGDMFEEEMLADPAKACYKHALRFCRIEPTSEYGISVLLYSIGVQYDIVQQRDSADFYYSQALANLPDRENYHYRDIVASKAILDYNNGVCPDSIIRRIKQVISLSANGPEKITRFLSLGSILFDDKQYDSSRVYLEAVFEQQEDIPSKIVAAENLFKIAQNVGDTIKAGYYSAFLADYTIPEIEKRNDASRINELFKNYLVKKQEKQAEAERVEAVISTVVFAIPFLIAVAAAIVVFARLRSKKLLEKQRAEAAKAIEAAEQELRQTRANANMAKIVDEPIYRLVMKRVNEGNFKAQINCGIYKDYALDKDQVTALREAVDRHFGLFTVRLSKAYPDLTTKDLDYCCFYLLGLTDADISALMQRAYPTVSQRSRKIKAILGSESPLPITLRGFAYNIQR